MSSCLEFIELVLANGEAALREPLDPRDFNDPALARRLEVFYGEHRLSIAGPLITFDPVAARSAAEWLWRACWFLTNREAPPDAVAELLPEPGEPLTPAAHLSADLLLRYLPQVYHRARSLGRDDVLTRWLTRVLLRWPLTGVLADIDEPPQSDLGFAGHAGLQLLYAERLVNRPRAAWLPGGAGREIVELVFAERGAHVPATAAPVQNSG